MVPALVLLIGACIWGVVLLVVLSLCKSAKAGDRAVSHDRGAAGESGPTVVSASADLTTIGPLVGIDLSTHRRPTRAPLGQGPEVGMAEAAEALGVEPEVLAAWEARYGYPTCGLPATGQGLSYAEPEISALTVALRAGLSVASAIAVARAVTTHQDATECDPRYRRESPD